MATNGSFKTPSTLFAEFYGKDIFSDITITYDDYEFKAHKIVLSKRSEYFKKVLEQHPVGAIELDEPGYGSAVSAMLRYIYTDHYVKHDDPQLKDWKFHLAVAAIAERYGHADLKDEALSGFAYLVEDEMHDTCWESQLKIAAEAESHGFDDIKQAALIGFDRATDNFPDVGRLLVLFEELPKYRHLDDSLERKEQTLFKLNFLELLQVPEQADRLNRQRGRAIHYLVKLAEAVLQLRVQIHSCGGVDFVTVDTLDQLVQDALSETPSAGLV
ncbi:BTB/POZ domain-containing protein 17 [Elasticomyces elasticus]|nr:BTB/POZ domain-containing protein 17 [Elasticomyces elasticus]